MFSFLHAISSYGTVSSCNSIHSKTTLAVWRRIPHITPLLYTVYLPITEVFLELKHYVSYRNSFVMVIGTKRSSIFSHVNGTKKHLFVSVIDRYVTFHHRRSLIPACIVCSKPSWSCMGTLGSTVLTSPWRWGWGGNAKGAWIPLWTLPLVNAAGMELTKCCCKRAVPAIVAATKPHCNKQNSPNICWPV